MERDELHPLHFGVGSHLPRPGCGAGGRDLMEACEAKGPDEAAGGGAGWRLEQVRGKPEDS